MENNIQQSNNTGNIKEKTPITMRVFQVLIIINAAIWFVFGILALLGGTTNPDQVSIMRRLSLLMFGDAAILIFIFRGTVKKQNWTYTGALIVLIINIFLSVTDEFGVADFIAIFASLAALIMLMTNKSIFDSFKKNK
ncbi:hypothetical protein KKA01_02140 [Patescibacteria group bacterium]|nr:hypothetical protein [Patescibacteria group bacterium]